MGYYLPMKHARKSSTRPAGSILPIGTDSNDVVLAAMIKHGVPLTRENWLKMAYPGGVPPLTAELESEVPKIFQVQPD